VEFLARLEPDGFAWRNADFSASAWIPANAGFPGANAEDSKSSEFDPVSCGQRLFKTLKN
jgi:hypothetical protein